MGVFVARADETRQVEDLLRTAEDGTVVAFLGMPGMGKRSLLDQLTESARNIEGVLTPPVVDLSVLALGTAQDAGPTQETAAALWRTFDCSHTLMQRMVDTLGARREFDAFTKLALAERSDAIKLLVGRGNAISAEHSRMRNVEMTTNVTFDEEAVKDLIRRSQKRIDDEFVECWEEWSPRHRVLLPADHFEVIAGDQLGQWFLRIALRLPHQVAVLASLQTAAPALQVASDHLLVKYLTPFSIDEVQRYFNERFGHGGLRPGIAEVTFRYTDGHPGAVRLIGDLLNERKAASVDADELRRTLDRLPSEPWAQLAELVRLILRTVSDPLLLAAVDACAVVNSFDEPLLAALLDASGASVGDTITALKGYGLVHQMGAGPNLPSNHLHLAGFVRQSLALDLRTLHPRRWEELHRRAASYYFEQLRAIEDGASGVYEGWYRYEKPQWQRCKTEWLFHSTQLPGERELTRARFVQVFLEAFYWWGCYQPFEFNHSLLWDWANSALSADRDAGPSDSPDEDQQLLDALTFLLDHYPAGYLKVSDCWDEIMDRLLLVQRLCGVGRGGRLLRASGAEAAEARRTAALIKVFLAHTRRYRDPADPEGRRYYDDALAIFEDLGDEWMTAWLLFECADLDLEKGAGTEAVELIARSATRLGGLTAGGDDWDEELVADLFRARGDAHWLAGQTDDAFACYGTAVRHAYLFQGIPHAPDSYSQRFYGEVTTRAAARLTELHRLGRDDDIARHWAGLQGVLPSDGPSPPPPVPWPEGDVSAVRSSLFPPGPAPAELGTETSAYMDRWRRFSDTAPETGPDLSGLAGQAEADPLGAGGAGPAPGDTAGGGPAPGDTAGGGPAPGDTAGSGPAPGDTAGSGGDGISPGPARGAG